MSKKFSEQERVWFVVRVPVIPRRKLIEDTSLNLDARGHAWRGQIGKGRLRLYDLVCTLAPGCEASTNPRSLEVID